MAGIVTVFIDGRGHAVEAGLVSGSRLRVLAGVGDDDPLALVRDAGPSTPLAASDVVLLCGDEKFALGEAAGDGAGDPPGDTGGPVEDTASGPSSAVTPEFNGARKVRVEGGKIAAEDLVGRDEDVASGRLFAVLGEFTDEGLDVEIPAGTGIVVQATDSYIVVPHPEDEPGEAVVEIEECTKHGRRPPRWHRYRIRVDRERFVVEKRVISGGEVLALVNKRPADWALNQKLRGGRRIRIEAHEEVDLAEPSVERFETIRRQAQQG